MWGFCWRHIGCRTCFAKTNRFTESKMKSNWISKFYIQTSPTEGWGVTSRVPIPHLACDHRRSLVLILLGGAMFFKFCCRQFFVILLDMYVNKTFRLAAVLLRTNVATNDVSNSGLATLRCFFFMILTLFFYQTKQRCRFS